MSWEIPILSETRVPKALLWWHIVTDVDSVLAAWVPVGVMLLYPDGYERNLFEVWFRGANPSAMSLP